LTAAPFVHRQSAHCESGVVSAMLTHHGLPLSEPMAFGLASALTFARIPIVKISGMPLITYRMPPRSIIRGVGKRLGIRMRFRTFRSPAEGMTALDSMLAAGRIVGLQTSVFWLPYFPEEMRFHFNAHNLIAFARDGAGYCLSDPVFEAPVTCDRLALQKSRFARGLMAPRGLMYYPEEVPERIDFQRAIPAAVRANYRIMMQAPFPFVGVRAIRRLGRELVQTAQRAGGDHRYLRLLLTHIVRMQEEIGTGGAGFRFVYAAFLAEAAGILGDHRYAEAADRMTQAGDRWREFAVQATRMAKARDAVNPAELATTLDDCAAREAAVWELLKAI
jgi:hypothetical protein